METLMAMSVFSILLGTGELSGWVIGPGEEMG